MKKVTVLGTFLALFLLGFNANAQSKIKLAHVNSTELMKVMPGVDTAQKAIQDYAKQLEDELKIMHAEFEKKYADFQRDVGIMTPTIRAMKEKELQDLQSRIQMFEEQAQADLQEKQEELLKPIVDRAKSAIEEVAKENGYNYVFDSGIGVLLYSDESDDILSLVKKKLGIK
ncbi:MAG: OmpH family outer membrane protein [Lentimicrobiaceae bacterium]|nr:OmpH family outer membrane protein [Lentimicrobiaceae bacterium]